MILCLERTLVLGHILFCPQGAPASWLEPWYSQMGGVTSPWTVTNGDGKHGSILDDEMSIDEGTNRSLRAPRLGRRRGLLEAQLRGEDLSFPHGECLKHCTHA